MSHNLTLSIGPAEVGLYQTPTEVTNRARVGGYVHAREVYFAWLDARTEERKPAIHPRATNAQRKAIMSAPAWRDYLTELELLEEHKAKVEQALRAGATWGST